MNDVNGEGYKDPTAEQAVRNVEKRETRYLPKELHKALKIMRDALSLIDYDIVDIRMRDRTDGKEYLWTEWK